MMNCMLVFPLQYSFDAINLSLLGVTFINTLCKMIEDISCIQFLY